ncbi:MAG: hypothetical protein HY423_14740 [Candidatus Lambdaproteobacteria bacterium]|nr:hypothetical protein [Candidatus Lambdaproteobacteria bacterium]
MRLLSPLLRAVLVGGMLAAPIGAPAAEAVLTGRVEVWERTGTELRKLEDASNAVVFVAGFAESPDPLRESELAQRNKSFSARVLVVTVGETVRFPNLDAIFHNVWSKSRAHPFDLGLYKVPEVKSVAFSQAGILEVFCNIHPQMIATIMVLPNNRFAVTGRAGSYRIAGIPAGEYPVYSWVEGATPIKHTILFAGGNTRTLDVKLQIKRIPLTHLNKEGKPYQTNQGGYSYPPGSGGD